LVYSRPARDDTGPVSAVQSRIKPGRRLGDSAVKFAEVEIILNEKFGLSDAHALSIAPGSDLQLSEDSTRVKLQIPAEKLEHLAADGVSMTVVSRFLLIEGSDSRESGSSGDFTALAGCSGDFRYAESDLDVDIPDDGSWGGSGVEITTAPAGATVTCVDVGYEVQHYYWSWLYIELTDADFNYSHVLYNDWYDGPGDIYRIATGITTFNGRAVNQIWALWIADGGLFGPGFIDYWWIKVYYSDSPYCGASGGCDEYISGVTVGQINNTGTGCQQYTDYTHLKTDVEIGNTYTLTVTNGNPYSGDKCGVWIDWNQDFDFEDSGEQMAVTGGPSVFTASVTPPPVVALGDTRMRIRIMYTGTLGSCNYISYGEVEDYVVTVTCGPLSISGYVKTSQGIPMPNVNVAATNGGNSDLTDSSGYYQLTAPCPWTGQVNTSKEYWVFQPLRAYFGITNDVTDANFTGTYLANPTPKISGYVRTGGGMGIADVLVLADSGQSDMTDGSGYYEFTVSGSGPVPEPWSGIVTPSKTDWEFDPVAIAYGNLSQDVADQNYTGTYTGGANPKISGYVQTDEDAGIEDVLVSAYNGGDTDMTDSNGFYELTVPLLWSGVVIPFKDKWVFDPASVSYIDLTADIPDQNFVGTYHSYDVRFSRYKIIDLGTSGDVGVPGFNVSNAYGINDLSQVVGVSNTSASAIGKAFFWEDANDNGQADPCEMQNIDTIWGSFTNSCSTSINNAGQVVGWGNGIISARPFLWEDDNANGKSDPGEMQELVMLPATSRGVVSRCNDNGQAVGNCNGFGFFNKACLWDLGTNSVVDLSTVSVNESLAGGINDAGQVVGYLEDADGNDSAFFWTDGDGSGTAEPDEMIELGTLGGVQGRAMVINNAGQVAGFAQDADGKTRAFMWSDANGNGLSDPCEMFNLGTLGFTSRAYGINDAGEIVGEFYTIDGDFGSRRAFLWNDVWGMVSLYELLCNPLGWQYLTEARAINNQGQIVGQGYTIQGEYHAFLMTPVEAADLNCDEIVDMNDLAVFSQQWLWTALLADISPASGDGLVDFKDWSVFANAWQSTPQLPNWDPNCDLFPEEGNDVVDTMDLAVFVDQWLRFKTHCADIVQVPLGDGIVDLRDFALLADQWGLGE